MRYSLTLWTESSTASSIKFLVPDFSTHQVIEQEYMSQEEYPEFIGDFTGFMLRKYIPRAFPALKGLEDIHFVPSIVLSTNPLASKR